jgi:hypothetical protein
MIYPQIPIDDNVFVFDVAMSDSVNVQIVDCLDNLGEYVLSLSFRESFIFGLFNTFEEVMGWTLEVLSLRGRGDRRSVHRRLVRQLVAWEWVTVIWRSCWC